MFQGDQFLARLMHDLNVAIAHQSELQKEYTGICNSFFLNGEPSSPNKRNLAQVLWHIQFV